MGGLKRATIMSLLLTSNALYAESLPEPKKAYKREPANPKMDLTEAEAEELSKLAGKEKKKFLKELRKKYS